MSAEMYPSVRVRLRTWATMIERDLLAPDEKPQVAIFLRALARGASVDEAFGLRPYRRPKAEAAQQRIWEVEMLRRPGWPETDGMSKSDALDLVAAAHGVDKESIEADYKTPLGREIVDQFDRTVYDPLTLEGSEPEPRSARRRTKGRRKES